MPRINSEKFYTSAIEMHGTSPKGVNWASKENQLLRFDAILKLLPKDLSSSRIADVGCEIINADICTPRAFPPDGQGTDELPNANYYLCSGALNVLTKFETHQFIQNCYNSSKIGFIFNALHGDKESETYNYLTTREIEEIAKDLNVQELVFKENYLEGDITVGFFR